MIDSNVYIQIYIVLQLYMQNMKHVVKIMYIKTKPTTDDKSDASEFDFHTHYINVYD